MTWVKLDDGFTDHPKVVGLSDKAFRVHVRALCYCARFTAGIGTIPSAALPSLGAGKAVVAELVGARLWDKDEAGELSIHDFSEYHPGPAARERRVEAGRLGGTKSGESRRSKREANASENRSNDEANASRNDEAKRSSRVDARPDPDPYPSQEESNDSSPQPRLPASFEAAGRRPPQPIPRAFAAAERLLGRSLNERESVLVGEWCEERNPEWVVQALDITRSKGIGKLNYAFSILDDWGSSGPPAKASPSPISLPAKRVITDDDPDFIGNIRREWPRE